MTTPTSTANNKTALRASLKKEDESLAERLAATDVPLVPPAEAESSEIPVPAAGTVVAPARKTGLATATGTAKPAKAAVVKSAAAAKAAAPAPAAKSAKRAAPAKASLPAAAAKSKSSGKGATMVAKPGTSGKVARSPSRVESAPAVAKTESGKKAGKLEEAVGKLEKSAREEGDKLVRHSVELLKSESAAIEGLRAELAKAAGWAASKSDILRAGVRLFAEQKVEQMKELLASLAAASGGKKKG